MIRLLLGLLFTFIVCPVASAQTPFFHGKAVRIVVGYLSGDSHDQFARVTARYMAKHIPGNPDFIVQNMPGAGSMIAANHVYNRTQPDGLTLGSISGGLYFAQVTGRKEVQFDWSKFTWIGSPDHNGHVVFIRSDSPYKTLEDLRNAKEGPRCSATGVGSSSYDVPRLLEDTLGLKLKVIGGYPGGGEQDLAIERNEVQCRAITTDTFFGREPFLRWYKSGFVRIFIQTSRQRDPKIPDVPTLYEAMDQFKTPATKRRFATAYLGVGAIGIRPIVGTPGIPADRVKILRTAYSDTLRDPEFLAEAKKRGWDIKPVSGEELEVIAKDVIDQPPDVVAWLKKLLAK